MSLLGAVRAQDPEAWRRLCHVYGPVLYRWIRAKGLNEHDAEDLVQDVFRSVFAGIVRFAKNEPGHRFRDWLWTIMHRRVMDHFRAAHERQTAQGGSGAYQQLLGVPSPDLEEGDSNPFPHAEMVYRCLEVIRTEFRENTWKACLWTVMEGRDPADVACELGISTGAVYVARSRVLKRLRELLDGLV